MTLQEQGLHEVDQLKQSTKDFEINASDRISFMGVRKLIRMKKFDHPILIVIQNVKTFPTNFLNDLIHLMYKYRNKYHLKLNLC